MELQRATKEGVLELDRISAKIGSTVNAVWGTIEGDITKQTDLQDELKKVKDSIPTKVPADGGNADTINGHTVECDVPANAKFTDTVYDDSAIKAGIANKVDKVSGKGLSTNDYTTAEKQEVAKIANKVDKVEGKQLSTEDYTTPEKQKLAGLSNYDDSALRKYIESLEEQNRLLKEQVAALQNQIDNTGWILLE